MTESNVLFFRPKHCVGMYNDAARCSVVAMSYAWAMRQGILLIDYGNSTHAPGVIALFEAIDPNVERVEVYAGRDAEPDITYEKNGAAWTVIDHRGKQ